MILAPKKKCNNCMWIGCTPKVNCPDCGKPVYECDQKEYTGRVVHSITINKFGEVVSEYGDKNKKVGIYSNESPW